MILCVSILAISSPYAQKPEDMMWPGFEAYAFDRSQYYCNVGGRDYTQAEINSIVQDYFEAGFTGLMLEFEYEYNSDYEGLGIGWYGPTNGDTILSRYFKDDIISQYLISAAKSYGLKVSVIISSLCDRLGTNEDGYTDSFSSMIPDWIYPNEKAFDLFKRKVDAIATLDVDEIVIDFARTPYFATDYSDTVIEVLNLTDNEINYINSNYPHLNVSVAANPTYRGGVSQNTFRIKIRGARVLHWENHDNQYTLGVESIDDGYFIFPVKPNSWWDMGGWTSVDLAEVLVYGTNSSPAVVFLHTPLSHDDYLAYSIQGIIGPGRRNKCPVLQPLENVGIQEGNLVVIMAEASDQENDSLTYHISDPRFEQNHNIFTWQTQKGDTGSYNIVVRAYDCFCEDSQIVEVVVTSLSCGDINSDGEVLIADVVYLINYLYNDGPAPGCMPVRACTDVNLDGRISISDIIYLINCIFKNGPLPCFQ